MSHGVAPFQRNDPWALQPAGTSTVAAGICWPKPFSSTRVYLPPAVLVVPPPPPPSPPPPGMIPSFRTLPIAITARSTPPPISQCLFSILPLPQNRHPIVALPWRLRSRLPCS